MDMQDKEFDELFRSKLDGLEAGPSANVWAGIVEGLESARRRRRLAPWLSIAASIVVLIGIGVFFIPNKISTHTEPSVKNPTVTITPPVTKVQVATTQPHKPAAPNTPVKLKRETEIARVETKPTIDHLAPKADDTAQIPAKTPVNADRQLMANIPAKTTTPVKPVVPDATIQLAVKQSIDQLPVSGLKPDKLAGRSLADNKKDSVAVKRKHRIHNFGDLVNMVVNKLDKRQDKVIQFADDEEGDSHLTGVNLGIVKIKKGE
jgi:hypothetical protein